MVKQEVDYYRDTWIRYFGYANEVGESMRHLVSRRVVRGSYTVATVYMLADTIDKSWRKMKEPNSKMSNVAATTCDVLIWQTLASIVIPGYTINRLCHYTNCGLKMYAMPPLQIRSVNMIVLAVGIGCIPIIVHPIDNAVTFIMNHTYRRVFPS